MAARTINTITITVARDSVVGVDFDKYLDRLLTEVYELPGVVVETEIDVNPGATTVYHGCINGEMDKPEALSEELKATAAKVLASMTKRK